jgi:UDP-glucose 4-epimerase
VRYFVTGGAGFVGSHLVDRLVERGEVTVYDNLSWGRMEFIEHHLKRRNFRLIKADILDFKTLKKAMAGHDCVFHFASGTDIRQGTAQIDFDINNGTIGTYNVLVAMKENGITKIVFSSSATVYGDAPVEPVAEDYGPLFPISLYGASKLACEGLITAFCHLFGMQAWVFRFSNVVGKRQTHGVIVDFIRKLKKNPKELEILVDGTQERPFFLVGDCIDGILFAFDHYDGQFDVFNLGCSTTTTVTAVAEMVTKEMGLQGVKFTYTGGKRGWPGDAPQVHFNIDKMTKLGWRTRYPSDVAVRMTIRDILNESG